jgi:hypothetical protein
MTACPTLCPQYVRRSELICHRHSKYECGCPSWGQSRPRLRVSRPCFTFVCTAARRLLGKGRRIPFMSDAEATRGTVSDAPHDATPKRRCVMCDTEIGSSARLCPSCKALQRETTECTSCGELISIRALRCVHCNAFQDWRRYFAASSAVLSLLIALVSVTATLLPTIERFQTRHSRTSLAIAGSDDRSVRVVVVNAGRRPSLMRQASLQFIGLPVEPVRLQVDDLAGVVISPDSHAIVRLFAPVVVSTMARQQLLERLGDAQVLVRMEVVESDGTIRLLQATASARMLDTFIQNHLAAP